MVFKVILSQIYACCHVVVKPLVIYYVRMYNLGRGGTIDSNGLQYWINTILGIILHYSG